MREAEFVKYERAYTYPNYRMKGARRDNTECDLAALSCRGSYLDVSCGRGEMLGVAERLGFASVHGTEIVESLIDGKRVRYAQAHQLPFADKSFDVVTMFDVIEHLLPGDDEAACREMKRVARKHILLTANNKPSFNKDGDDLHINRRPYPEWDGLFREWFDARIIWLKGDRISEAWRIDL